MDASFAKREQTENVRAFVAVELPDALREQLGTVQTEFGSLERRLKWVAPPLMHVTVKFLGNVLRSRVPAIVDALTEAASRSVPFRLTVRGLGAFPNTRAPRVLWAGLADDGGKETLAELFSFVEHALADEGLKREERAYSPHITIARTRDDVSSPDRRLIGERFRSMQEQIDIKDTFTVKQLTLMESTLSRSGPVYTALARLPLGDEIEGAEHAAIQQGSLEG